MGAGAGAQKITTDVTGNDTAGMVAGMVASGVTAKGLNGIEAEANKLAKAPKGIDGVTEGAGNLTEDVGKAGKGLEGAAKGAESAAEDAGKVVESGTNSINSLDDLLTNPNKLSGVSGEELYNYLVKNGYDVKPLNRGSFKGIPFEEGGGFKVNWGGDRILQYHPENLSHHGGAYFKISSGETGTIRIDLDGNLIN